MSDNALNQHKRMAMGQGLDSPPSKGGSPGYAKGGKVGPKSGFKPMGKSGKARPKGC